MATMQNPPHLIPIHPAALSETEGFVEGKHAPEPRASAAPPPIEEVPATTFVERIAKRVGLPQLLLMLRNRKAITSELRAIPSRMQLITNQARLVLELVDDFRSGAYREVSWVSIAVAAAGLVYAVSPGDVVPDALPVLGALDDMVVITLVMRFLQKDLRAYCHHKGYAEKDYFG